jgi:hypothetical protein
VSFVLLGVLAFIPSSAEIGSACKLCSAVHSVEHVLTHSSRGLLYVHLLLVGGLLLMLSAPLGILLV